MSLVTGARVGPYEIVARLGAGGMGEVYQARDARLDRAVAIKVLTSARAIDPAQLDRFQREARAIARVSHPHICTLHDVGQQDGVPYLVMELLEGETLAERLALSGIPVQQALVIAVQIAEALDAAHSKGVVHRDLKPSNVMLTAAGVKLVDFGLAKLRDAGYDDDVQKATRSLQLTEDGIVIGTLPYMAPEQVAGRGADARTDVFALGIVLFEMTTGRKPFGGDSRASLMAAILTDEPPPLSVLRPETPANLDRIVKKCLAKNPDERWQSARDLASALQWSTDDTAAHIPAARTGWRQRRRVRRRVIGAVAMVAVAAAIAVWAGAGGSRAGKAATTGPKLVQVTFRTGSVNAARFAPDGDTIVYSAAWGVNPYALFMTRVDNPESRPLDVRDAKLLGVSTGGDIAFLRGTHRTLKVLAPAGQGTLARVSIAGGGPRDLLDDVIAADWRPGTTDLAVVRREQVEFPLGTKIHGAHTFSAVRVAPDGQRLALVEGPNIVVLDRAGRKTTLSTDWSPYLSSLAWSATGDEVWFTVNRRLPNSDLTTWALRGVSLDGKERVILPARGVPLSILDVARDGRVLMVSQYSKMGCACQGPGDTRPHDFSWLDGTAPEALSADGRLVLFAEMLRAGGAPSGIYLRNTDGSDAIRLADGFPEDLSPDGKWVLAAPAGRRTHWILVPTGPGQPRALPPGPVIARGEANFLPDGRHVVFGGREQERRWRVYVQDTTTGTVRAISPERVVTTGLATVDGRAVLGSSGGKHFKYPVDGGTPIALPFLSADDLPLQWTADGRTLYVWRTADWPPTVDRVDVASGHRSPWKTIQPADPVGVDNIIRILVTPDGRTYCHDYVRILSELFVVEGLT